jgi:hypothetical protein
VKFTLFCRHVQLKPEKRFRIMLYVRKYHKESAASTAVETAAAASAAAEASLPLSPDQLHTPPHTRAQLQGYIGARRQE